MQHSDLVRMANEIATFFKPYGEERAIEEIANHIKKFWDPRMRRQIVALTAKADNKLDPFVLGALETLAEARSM